MIAPILYMGNYLAYLTYPHILRTFNTSQCPFVPKVIEISAGCQVYNYRDWSFNTDPSATRRMSQSRQSLVTRDPNIFRLRYHSNPTLNLASSHYFYRIFL